MVTSKQASNSLASTLTPLQAVFVGGIHTHPHSSTSCSSLPHHLHHVAVCKLLRMG